MTDLGQTALGAWSGGHFMHFGERIDDRRLDALLRPDERVRTVVTADVYGQGDADRVVGAALADMDRHAFRVVGMVGHDFVHGTRDGAKGFPRFTDARLRGPQEYASYLREVTEQSLERCGLDRFDVLMLHNPDRTGYTSPQVWRGMGALRDAGLADALGVAPGPANGFTLDLIRCIEAYEEQIEWAMLISNPFEPWPARLALPACERHGIKVLARVVDYGGIFHDDVPDEDALAPHDHRGFRPQGWVQAARTKLDEIRPIGERHGLTPLQLACQWTLAQPAVECVVPTLIQEPGADAKPIEHKRSELAELPAEPLLTAGELAEIDRVGDNTNHMVLKGGTPAHRGDERADAWPMDAALQDTAGRWGIVPERDLVMHG